MAKFPTMEELAKQVAEKAKEELTINDMPLTEFLVKVDEVAGYLQSEIDRTELYMSDNDNPMYDGVLVGTPSQRELNRKHIWFCKHILEMLGIEDEK